ncbi:MAG: hypothetical protein KC478_09070 [Bacteriovoracaceae bacterium]|nr:hypothetical protein [Bacteriovoracaceae bacterium]
MSSKLKFILAAALTLVLPILVAQVPEVKFRVTDLPIKLLGSLKPIPIPGPSDEMLGEFVRDKKAAIQLGKALFWDTRVGSDNKTACATCHFHAGIDNRVQNQLNPGLLGNDELFQFGGPNYNLKAHDFPSALENNEVVSSQGVFNAKFVSIESQQQDGADECEIVADKVFHGFDRDKHPVNTRRVESRHTPSVINAVFYFRQFWDGRGNNVFNGIDPFGLRNEGSYVWKSNNSVLKKELVKLPSSSLASQASGPPLSSFEMSCADRIFHHVGKKMLYSGLLNNQKISIRDSVLGEYADKRPQYAELIKKAFRSEYWDSREHVYSGARAASMDLIKPSNLKTQMNEGIPIIEANFALFYGLSLQLYMSTLVSDETPFDRFAEGDVNALTERQKRGMEVFKGPGACIRCHGGPEFTASSFSNVTAQRLLTIPVGPGITLDNGFFNIGVRPTSEDAGVGGLDPFGMPMSETRMVQSKLGHLLGNDFDPEANPKPEDIAVMGVDGAFKTPSLRNVELTGPYFHNGGKSTLRQVVEFYNRGGDFRDNAVIAPLGLTNEQMDDLVAFLLSLTDERVRLKKAPFDHPSLCFPDGHVGRENFVQMDPDNKGQAIDKMTCIPAVGRYGVRKRFALKPFLNLDPFSP